MAKKKTRGRPAKAKTAKKTKSKAAKTRRPASKARKVKKSKTAKRPVARKSARKTKIRKVPARKIKTSNAKSGSAKARKSRDVVGEGNYSASRRFRKAETAFVTRNKDKIAAMGAQAEAALEGAEGNELRAAEDEARAHAHTPEG